jgi:hypothetical protein
LESFLAQKFITKHLPAFHINYDRRIRFGYSVLGATIKIIIILLFFCIPTIGTAQEVSEKIKGCIDSLYMPCSIFYIPNRIGKKTAIVSCKSENEDSLQLRNKTEKVFSDINGQLKDSIQIFEQFIFSYIITDSFQNSRRIVFNHFIQNKRKWSKRPKDKSD